MTIDHHKLHAVALESVLAGKAEVEVKVKDEVEATVLQVVHLGARPVMIHITDALGDTISKLPGCLPLDSYFQWLTLQRQWSPLWHYRVAVPFLQALVLANWSLFL